MIKAAVINPKGMSARESSFNVDEFKTNPDKFTIVDIRSRDENHNSPIFEKAMNIPLQELRERTVEIPDEKPILVHCAGGYRSAAGSSIVAGQKQNVEVFDCSEEIKNFQ